MNLKQKSIGGVVLALGFLAFPIQAGADSLTDELDTSPGTWKTEAYENSLSMTDERWTVTLAGGMSLMAHGDTHMTVPDAHVQIESGTTLFFLNFPGATYTANDFDNGYSAQGVVTRQMNDWFSLGLQLGSSFGHSQEVSRGIVPFSTFDSLGNLISVEDVGYNIDYKVSMFHAVPLITFGHYFPIGKFAWKPYVSGGIGFERIEESVVFHIDRVDFDMGKRATNSATALLGGGIDFRLSPAGSIGVQVQSQRTVSSGHDWATTTPTLRFSYLF